MNIYFEFQTSIINTILKEEKINKHHIKIFKNKLKDILQNEESINVIMSESKVLKDDKDEDNKVYSSIIKLNNESVPIIIKTSNNKHTLLYEYFVGVCGINFLREHVPCFSIILGRFSFNNNDYIVYENIFGDSFKKVITTSSINNILRYLLCILLSLQYSQQEINFVHYDVHTDNIIMKDEPTILSFRIGYKVYNINTDKIPVFIDYEFSHFVPKFTNIPFGGKYFPKYSIDPTITNNGYDMYKIIMYTLYILFSINIEKYNELKWILEFFKDKYDQYGIYKNKNNPSESFNKGFINFFSLNTFDNISPIDFINWIQDKHTDIFNEYIDVKPLDLNECITIPINILDSKYPIALKTEIDKINLSIYSSDLIYINKITFPIYSNYIDLYNTYYLFSKMSDNNFISKKLEKYKEETRIYIFNNLKNSIIDYSLDFFNIINNLKILYPELYPFIKFLEQNYINNALSSMSQIFYLSTSSNVQLKYLFYKNKHTLFQLLNKHLTKSNFNFSKTDSELNSIMKNFKKNYQNEEDIRGLSRIRDLEKLNINTDNIKMYLDYGGGNGDITKHISKWLKLEKKNSICIDISTWEQHSRIKKYPNILTYIDIEDMQLFPFSNNTFDFITCFQVLHHIKCIDLSLKELSRVLKNSGILVLREHDCRNVLDMMLIDVEHSIYEMVIENEHNPTYLSNYFAYYRSKEEWNDLLLSYGFKSINNSDIKGSTRYYYNIYQLTK